MKKLIKKGNQEKKLRDIIKKNYLMKMLIIYYKMQQIDNIELNKYKQKRINTVKCLNKYR